MKFRPFTHRICIDIALAFGLIVLVVGKVGGQDKDLVEAAKKEGKVRIFGSIQDDVVKSIQSSFERKYPGVKSTYWRASTTAVIDRAMNEFRSGKVSWEGGKLRKSFGKFIKAALDLASFQKNEL